MDQSCYKCGHAVEDGKAFCAQCRAPQIRVAMPEIPVALASVSGTAAEFPIFPPDPTIAPGSFSSPLSPEIAWPAAIRTCAFAALIAAVVMAFGLIIPLLAILGAGFLAVILYRRQNRVWSVNARSGAQLGAVCGALFFAISAIFEALATAVFRTGGELRQKMIEGLQLAASRSSDPQVQAAFEQLKTPEGIALMMIFGMLVLLVFTIAAGALSGALTGAFLGRRNRS
jgi:hypothetical protein